MVFLFVLSFFLSLAMAVLCIRTAHGHAKRYGQSKPQRFHMGDVPRLGGIAVLYGMAVAWLVAILSEINSAALNVDVSWTVAGAWLVPVLPAVLGGVAEDVMQKLVAGWRLALTGLSAGLACYLLELAVQRLGLEWADSALLAFPWVGVVLAFVAICGLPHAFNIIDGYNGLAGTVALLIGLALVHVALQVGDRQLAAMVICMVGATAGFLVLNYPRGLLFAGDGGAYLWGVVIAVASILLVQRHSQVSPWFPMLLLIYPVWETIFSIYRKLARGTSPGVADALHFHQLIFRRIVRGVFDDDESRRMLIRNNRTSPYLWGFTLLTVVPAVLFWRNTYVLMGFCALFVVSYVVAYFAIIRFKVPDWLRH
jgi:UDP-GlcNAc:undecaprenyl-phosphate/decaprenyl-phosphate GlcNAc-1-phosphate transferase